MSRACLTAFVLALLASSATAAGRPEASFALVDGWIEARVERDGKPVPGASVEVFDVIGASFAKGETGESGVGTFPKPNGHTCRLAVVVDGKPCDSVLLTFEGTAVHPPRVQLTFGDRSCCRTTGRGMFLTSGDEDNREPTRRVALLVAAGGCCLTGALALALSLRRRVVDLPPVTEQGPNRDDATS